MGKRRKMCRSGNRANRSGGQEPDVGTFTDTEPPQKRDRHWPQDLSSYQQPTPLPFTSSPSLHLLDKGFHSAQANELPRHKRKTKGIIVCAYVKVSFVFIEGDQCYVRVIPLKRLRGCCFRSECIQECFQKSPNV